MSRCRSKITKMLQILCLLFYDSDELLMNSAPYRSLRALH